MDRKCQGLELRHQVSNCHQALVLKKHLALLHEDIKTNQVDVIEVKDQSA